MIKSLIYTFLLFLFSFILFVVVTKTFQTIDGSLTYLLGLIVTHFILEKNYWLIDLLASEYFGDDKIN